MILPPLVFPGQTLMLAMVLPGTGEEDAARDEEEGRRNEEEDEEEPLRLVHVEPENDELLESITCQYHCLNRLSGLILINYTSLQTRHGWD